MQPQEKKKRGKRYNGFNIFFMLERQLLLHARGGGINTIEKPIDTSHLPLIKHKDLSLPPLYLCQRYAHLPLTKNWFLELQANQAGKKRAHKKSHGLIPFKELAQVVAKNYKEIDEETQAFITEVTENLGWHCDEIEAIEEVKEMITQKRSMKKRKSPPPPIIFGGNKRSSLNHDEADTGNSRSSPVLSRNASQISSAGHPPVYPQAVTSASSPPESQAYPSNPSHIPSNHPSAHLPAPASHPDPEVHRLRLKIAASINARLEAERRRQSIDFPANVRELPSQVLQRADYQSVYPQAPSPPESGAHILRLELSRAHAESRARLPSAEMSRANRHESTMDLPSNLPEPPLPMDSEAERLQLELTHAWNAHFENDRKIEVIQHSLQEQMKLRKNDTDLLRRARFESQRQYPHADLRRRASLESQQRYPPQVLQHHPSQDHMAHLAARGHSHTLPRPGWYEQYNLANPAISPYRPLPAAAGPPPSYFHQVDSRDLRQTIPPLATGAAPTPSPRIMEITNSGITSYLARLEEELLHEAFTRGGV